MPPRRHLLSCTQNVYQKHDRIPTAWRNSKLVIIFKNGNQKTSITAYRYVYYQTYIKYSRNYSQKSPRNTKRKRVTRASRIKEHVLSDRPHREFTPIEEVPRMYPALHCVRRLGELRTVLAWGPGDRRRMYIEFLKDTYTTAR